MKVSEVQFWRPRKGQSRFQKESSYLIRIMFQGAVVTLISNPIHVCVPLVHIIDVLAVVSFIEDICREQGTNESQNLQPRLFSPNRTLTARAEKRSPAPWTASLRSGRALPSPSMSAAQASPSPLLSVSAWSGLWLQGQLSQRSPTSSLSQSYWAGLQWNGQLSCKDKTQRILPHCGNSSRLKSYA